MTREREKRKERASLEGDQKKYVLNMYFFICWLARILPTPVE
jgi:hypothetical protein